MKLILEKHSFSYLIAGLLAFLILGALTNSNVFIYSSLAAYYSYVIISCLLISLSGITLIADRKRTSIVLPLPIILLMVFGLYVILHGKLVSGVLNIRHTFLIVTCVFILALFLIFKLKNFRTGIVLWIITIAAILESVLCIVQSIGWVNSKNPYFEVTGSWANPNVTAMFLAISLPAALSLNLLKKAGSRKAGAVISIVIIIGLILLKCRTAYIGAGLSTLITFNYRYNIFKTLKDKRHLSGSILLGLIFLFILIFASLNLYKSKKASADGRKLIWKVSINMITAKPITGYGYGRFEHNYNLIQEAFIRSGQASKGEVQNAGYVKMAYNEYLEKTIEGGVIGLLIFSGILISLLWFPVSRASAGHTYFNNEIIDKSAQISAYSGIASFAIMSVFNFSVQAIPLTSILAIYIVILSFQPRYFTTSGAKWISPLILPDTLKRALGIALLGLSIYTCFGELQAAKAHFQNKKAALLIQQGKYMEAKNILNKIQPILSQSDSYWKNVGDVLYLSKQYSKAAIAFNNTKIFSSNPDIYFITGRCYEKIGNYKASEENFLVAKNIEPTRFKHRHVLLDLYIKSGQNSKAILTAHEILSLKPKIPSVEVKHCKDKAFEVLKKFGIAPASKKQFPLINSAYNL